MFDRKSTVKENMNKSKVSNTILDYKLMTQIANFTSPDCWFPIKKSNHDQERRTDLVIGRIQLSSPTVLRTAHSAAALCSCLLTLWHVIDRHEAWGFGQVDQMDPVIFDIMQFSKPIFDCYNQNCIKILWLPTLPMLPLLLLLLISGIGSRRLLLWWM